MKGYDYDASFLFDTKIFILFFKKILFLAKNSFCDDQIYFKISQNV